MRIWVDDLRPAPAWDWIQAFSSSEAILILDNCLRGGVSIDIMSLDHDLGGDDTTRPIVLWMIENDFWPVEVVVHSANPVGCDWLNGMIERYRPMVCDFCSRPAIAMVGEGNEILVCEVHLERYKS